MYEAHSKEGLCTLDVLAEVDESESAWWRRKSWWSVVVCGWLWLFRASQRAMAAPTLTICWRLLIESLFTRIKGRPYRVAASLSWSVETLLVWSKRKIS